VTSKQIQLKQLDMALFYFESYFATEFEKYMFGKTEDQLE